MQQIKNINTAATLTVFTCIWLFFEKKTFYNFDRNSFILLRYTGTPEKTTAFSRPVYNAGNENISRRKIQDLRKPVRHSTSPIYKNGHSKNSKKLFLNILKRLKFLILFRYSCPIPTRASTEVNTSVSPFCSQNKSAKIKRNRFDQNIDRVSLTI